MNALALGLWYWSTAAKIRIAMQSSSSRSVCSSEKWFVCSFLVLLPYSAVNQYQPTAWWKKRIFTWHEVFAMILVHHWYLYLYIYTYREIFSVCIYIYICTHLKQNLIWGQFWGPIWPPLLYTAPRSSDSIPICLEQPMVGRKSFTNLLQLLGFPYSKWDI